MFDSVATKDPTAVEVAVQQAYLAMFPGGDRMFVPRVFGWAIECFTGNYADYQAVDARYPKAQVRDFDGDPKRLTEMDALVAYLQVLGTMVDVNSAAAQETRRPDAIEVVVAGAR